MTHNPVDEWFAEKMQRSARMSQVSSLVLIPLAVLAAAATWFVLFVLSVVALLIVGWSWKIAFGTATVFLALTFVWQFTIGKNDRPEHEFEGKVFSGMEWALIRSAGSGWGVFVFDPELGGPLVRFVSAVLLTSPRMLQLSGQLKRRAARLEQADAALCAKVVRRMVKTQKRVTVQDMHKNLPDADVASLVQILTDVDGIVFLTKNGIGLTLAPRFNEEFQAWHATHNDADDFEDEPESAAPAPPASDPDSETN